PVEALVLGLALLAAGLGYLQLAVGAPAALVTTSISATYLLLYTPLKPVTALCSLVGAVPGALPPVAGWAAPRGRIGPEAWGLFAIMYLWQIPHTLAIGRMYRDDYARAGIRVLPVIDGDGSSTAIQAVVNCLALLPVALLPTLLGMAGPFYFATALVLGLGFLWSAHRPRRHAGVRRRRAPPRRPPALSPGPARHDGARQASDHAMTAGALPIPRRPASTTPDVREPAVSNTRLAIVIVITAESMLFA